MAGAAGAGGGRKGEYICAPLEYTRAPLYNRRRTLLFPGNALLLNLPLADDTLEASTLFLLPPPELGPMVENRVLLRNKHERRVCAFGSRRRSPRRSERASPTHSTQFSVRRQEVHPQFVCAFRSRWHSLALLASFDRKKTKKSQMENLPTLTTGLRAGF